jgi:hypothetical protein
MPSVVNGESSGSTALQSTALQSSALATGAANDERLGLREFMAFVAQSHTPPDRCVRFAPAVTGYYATLTTRRRATIFTGTGLSPAGTRQLLLTHHNHPL